MDFELPEHLLEIQRSVRQFCEEEVKPFARGWDEAGAFPTETVRRLGQLGVMGMIVPERYGGAELGALGVAVVVEEVARHDGSLALTVASAGAYAAGYRDGIVGARKDRYRHKSPDPTRHDWYRDANRGYRGGDYRSRDDYQQRYRQGYVAGYNDAYSGQG